MNAHASAFDSPHSQPLNELRRQTHEQHQRLERELRIESQLADRESYRRLLTSFYGYWSPWESRVEESGDSEILNFFASRSKRAALEADLEYLGMNRREIEELPVADVPRFAKDDELLGSMYVTEGSTLGGQIISRMIEERLRLENGDGYNFYRSYGVQVGTMWREFGRFLNERISSGNIEAAVAGAQRTFEGIRQWLGEKR